jgi:hypothetical protein
VLGLDLLEQQDVGNAEHRRECEARIGEEHAHDVQREERAAQDLGPCADFRIEHGDDVERDEQRRHEDAHRALVGGQLDVEVSEAEQPDERRERRRRPDERGVPGLHRAHADQKGMREDAARQERRRQPAGSRVPPRKVREVCGRRGRIQKEREQAHG